MTALAPYGWWLDYQPASALAFSQPAVVAAGGYYFEVTITSGGADGTGGYGILFGICNASTVLVGTVANAINAAQPNSAGACFTSSRANNPTETTLGWGYPNRPTGIPVEATGLTAVYGVAIDTTNKKVWWRNITDASPAAGLYGGGTNINTGNPATNVQGADFSSGGPSPVTGPIYILVGASHGATTAKGTGTVNFGASAFTGTAPSGFVSIESAFPGATLNPADNSNLVLSNGNLSFSGANVPVTFSPAISGFSTNVGFHNCCRSRFSIAQAP